ncbi:TIGR00341 family protein [Patescibacteria group bacterium]|nr:TIGR00341 family protein [Patescibacteria group bacterium]
MAVTLFRSLSEEDKNTAIESLIADSTPRDDFFFMGILAVLMATFGMLMNNAAVVIGSMLIAPLLSPILSLSLGIIMFDAHLMARSFFTILKGLLLMIPAAILATWLFSDGISGPMTEEIILRTDTSIVAAAIGLLAGIAASFALIKPQLSAHLPGVAISVALIPPISAVGIGLARLDGALAGSALLLLLINIATIIFGSMIIFLLMSLYVKRGVADKAVNKEDTRLKKEQKQADRAAKPAAKINSPAKSIIFSAKKILNFLSKK